MDSNHCSYTKFDKNINHNAGAPPPKPTENGGCGDCEEELRRGDEQRDMLQMVDPYPGASDDLNTELQALDPVQPEPDHEPQQMEQKQQLEASNKWEAPAMD